jgi:putative phage-type endonuclease
MSNAQIALKADKPARPQPALKLVKTNTLDRDQWLTVRKQGIGSSDAAAAVGLNPYCSKLELWLVKTGRDGNLPKIDPKDDTNPVWWGTLLEGVVASQYTNRTGNRVRRINAVLQHPKEPWMLANIDREVMGAPDVQVLECKTAGINTFRSWTEGVPEPIQIQVQHQLAVTSKQAADVAVLICGQDLQIHRIQRDEALIAKLIELERAFWHYVETDTPPPADGSDSADVALRALYPRDSGQTLDLSGDLEMSAVFSDLLAVRDVLTKNSLLEAQLKQTIQQRMGDATKVLFDTGDVTWKRSRDSSGIDTATLLKDQPELLSRYSLVKPGSRRFLVNG